MKHHQRESVDQDALAAALKRPMGQAPVTYVVPWMSDDMDAGKHARYQIEPALIHEQPNPRVSYALGIDTLRPPRDKA